MWRALVLLPLCGCLLTKAMWAPSGKVIPEVDYQAVDCEVVGARGELAPTARDTRIEIDLVPVGDCASMPHTTTWTRERPGGIVMHPPSYEVGWWFATPSFEAEGWDVAVYGGAVFKRRGTFNARVEIWGTADPESLGRRVFPGLELPLQPAGELLAPEWERRARIALAEHDWGWLLTGERGVSLRPRAWMAEGKPLTRLGRRAPHECTLIVELGDRSGATRFYEIAADLLAGSFGQRLTRTRDCIEWRYAAVWWARHEASRGLPAFDVPLPSATIAYEWGYEERLRQRPLWDAMRVVLTPITVVLDVVIATSPTLQRFVRELLDLPEPLSPRRRSR